MTINTLNIKTNLNDLNKLLETYQHNSLNLDKCLLECKNYWLGEKANSFLEKVKSEKNEINNNIIELRSLISIYDYILNEYSNIGEEIFYDLKKFAYVNSLFDDYINSIEQIVMMYNKIPISYEYLIGDQKNYFILLKESIISTKNKFNLIIDRINNIEDNVSLKVSQFDIRVIKETTVTNIV